MKNKYFLKGFVHIVGIIMLLIVVLLLFAIYVLPHLKDGRIGISFPWGGSIVSPAPREELLQYMNDKYNTEFFEITEAEYSDKIGEMDVWRWENNNNGIIVRTASYPGHYFYVRKHNGKITDNYGYCIVQDEAQQLIYDELFDIIEYDFKIRCQTLNIQNNECNANLTAIEYIENCNYHFAIYICSDGKNREHDLERIKPKLMEIFKNSPTSKHTIQMCYYNQEYFDQINTSWYSSDMEAAEFSNWWGYGFLEDDNSEFTWIDGKKQL